MPYAFAQLLPVRARNSKRVNAGLLGQATYGVEVTEAELAAQCGLGNLDPQHGPGGCGEAAIEAALVVPLPPEGTRLVTIRPDMDALGAMAILTLRAEGAAIGAELRERVALVGRADRFDFGRWPGPKPFPDTDAEWLEFATEPFGLAPIAALAGDANMPLEARVVAMRRWLETAEIPAAYRNTAANRAADLAAAWRAGEIKISSALGHRIAIVVSSAVGTLRLGYRDAPVVLAVAAAPADADAGPRKIAIAHYNSDYVDLAGLATDFNAIETGWGGSATILGSPQGVGSSLPLAKLIASIEKRFTPFVS